MEESEDICRICLDSSAFVSLLGYNPFDENIKNKLCHKLFACTSVHTSADDILPKNICDSCVSKLEAANRLRLLAQQSDNTLRRRYGLAQIEYYSVKCEAPPSIYIKIDPKIEECDKLKAIIPDSDESDHFKDNSVESEDETDHFNDFFPDSPDAEAHNSTTTYFIPDTNYIIKEEPGTYTLLKNPSKIKESKLKKSSTKESKTKSKGRLKRTVKTIKRLKTDTNNKLDIELNVKIENNGESWADGKTDQSGDGAEAVKPEGEDNSDGGSKQPGEGKQEKGYVCEMCNELFKHRHMFYRHMKKGHGIEGYGRSKEFMCDICGSTFYDPYGLRMHVRSHSGDRPFTCAECGQGFTQQSNMERHISARHRKDKPFQCEECSKRFAYTSTLREHMRAHRGEQNHACDICARRFSRRFALVRHQVTHTHARPYECRHCGSTYTQTNDLKAHVKRTHVGAITDRLVDYCIKLGKP